MKRVVEVTLGDLDTSYPREAAERLVGAPRGELDLSRVPLAMADLSERTTDEEFPLFRACQDAGCWT